MDLNKINNLYVDRYSVTLNVIEEIYQSIDSGNFITLLSEGRKIVPTFLGDHLEKLEEDEE